MTRKTGNSRDGYGVPARVCRAGAPGLLPQLTASRPPRSSGLILRCLVPPRSRKCTVTRSHPREAVPCPLTIHLASIPGATVLRRLCALF